MTRLFVILLVSAFPLIAQDQKALVAPATISRMPEMVAWQD